MRCMKKHVKGLVLLMALALLVGLLPGGVLAADSAEEITVGFTLVGGEYHGGSGETQTLAGGNLTEWLAPEVYTVYDDATVLELFETAMDKNGLSWVNDSGSYVTGVTYRGTTLNEFDNGPNSGWLFSVNGSYATQGIADQGLEDGDEVVFHWTDNYWHEDMGWTADDGDEVIHMTPEVEGGRADTTVYDYQINWAILAARALEDDAVSIVVDTGEQAFDTSNVALTVGAIRELIYFDIPLTVDPGSGLTTLTFDTEALTGIAADRDAGDYVVITALVSNHGPGAAADYTPAQGPNGTHELRITVAGEALAGLDGTVTARFPYTPAQGESTSSLRLYRWATGSTLEELTDAWYAGGVFTAEITHLSTYTVGVVTDAPEDPESPENPENPADPEDPADPVWENPYTDVTEADWFYGAVQFVTERGLMEGFGDGLFGPGETMSRAMFVTVLYRYEGEPQADTSAPFTDVVAGEWYADAVVWARANEIVEGYGDGTFGTGDDVTREQMAAILHRYADYKGLDTSARGDLSGYPDAEEVSDWAEVSMSWANGEKLIIGRDDGKLHPLEASSRADVATVLMRFIADYIG